MYHAVVDTTSVAELVPLLPCSGAGSGMVTSGDAAVDSAWGLRRWMDWYDGGLILPATCWTSCWRRMSVADNAWLLVVAWLSASVSPTDAVLFHRNSKSKRQSLWSVRASTTEWA